MILVTGGAGYLGCVAVRQLLERGEAVRVFDNLLFGDGGLSEIRGQIDLVRGDLRRMDPSVLNGVDAVLHLGGLSNDPMAEYNPRANREMNTLATQALAEACRKKGIRRFVFASSCSIYDLGFDAEDFLRDEESEVRPRAAYAVSKYEAERALLKLAGESFCPVILRQGTVYGFSPRMRYDLVVNTFVKDAMRDGRLKVFCGGEMWRPLIDVTDVARAYLMCLYAKEEVLRGQIFNLAFKNFRILELAHWVREAFRGIRDVAVDVDYSSFNTRSYRVSSKKIENVLGYQPKVSVKESVGVMVEQIEKRRMTDFLNPRYYNIEWLKLLEEAAAVVKSTGGVFD